MATVIQNVDNTFTVTLNAREQAIVQRWAALASWSPSAQLADQLNILLSNKGRDFRMIDAQATLAKYEALTPDQQAAVDAILK